MEKQTRERESILGQVCGVLPLYLKVSETLC